MSTNPFTKLELARLFATIIPTLPRCNLAAFGITGAATEKVEEMVQELPHSRATSPVASLLLLLEKAFDCTIPDVPQWVPVFQAILKAGPVTQFDTGITAPATWRSWLHRILPGHSVEINAVCMAQEHVPVIEDGGEAPLPPTSTPPRSRIDRLKTLTDTGRKKALHRAKEQIKRNEDAHQRSLRARQRPYRRQG